MISTNKKNEKIKKNMFFNDILVDRCESFSLTEKQFVHRRKATKIIKIGTSIENIRTHYIRMAPELHSCV